MIYSTSPHPPLTFIENLTEIVIKQAVHAQKPSNVSEIKQFFKEEWN